MCCCPMYSFSVRGRIRAASGGGDCRSGFSGVFTCSVDANRSSSGILANVTGVLTCVVAKVLYGVPAIAQGFATHHFELKDGTEVDGFVVQEAADTVTIRNVAAQEIKIKTSEITCAPSWKNPSCPK